MVILQEAYSRRPTTHTLANLLRILPIYIQSSKSTYTSRTWASAGFLLYLPSKENLTFEIAKEAILQRFLWHPPCRGSGHDAHQLNDSPLQYCGVHNDCISTDRYGTRIYVFRQAERKKTGFSNKVPNSQCSQSPDNGRTWCLFNV